VIVNCVMDGTGLRGVHVCLEVHRAPQRVHGLLLQDLGSDTSPGEGDAKHSSKDHGEASR